MVLTLKPLKFAHQLESHKYFVHTTKKIGGYFGQRFPFDMRTSLEGKTRRSEKYGDTKFIH